MKNEITIRAAKNHDARNIFAFLCEMDGRLLDRERFESNYRLCISDVNNVLLVAANQSNDAVGYIACHGKIVLRYEGILFEVQELFIEKNFRKKGIGKMLLKALAEKLAEAGYNLVEEKQDERQIKFAKAWNGN
ncbi:MAG: GNAT family N-acetyltransferase [Bacteroidetes bacterium]|nr:GNAT family N-acetyltransferase [Bacteroidota bacterium]